MSIMALDESYDQDLEFDFLDRRQLQVPKENELRFKWGTDGI